MLFQRVRHDFLVTDLALNFTFFLGLFRSMVAGVVSFHGFLLEDLAADVAGDLQESLFLGRQVHMGLVVLLEL